MNLISALVLRVYTNARSIWEWLAPTLWRQRPRRARMEGKPLARRRTAGRYLVGSILVVCEIDHPVAIIDFDIQHAQHGETQRAGYLGSSTVADI